MTDRICSVNGCGRPFMARGWCRRHWDEWRSQRDVIDEPKPERAGWTAERFWAATTVEDACVVWTGWRDPLGYGRIYWTGRNELTHRIAFYLRMGRWPEGVLRHLCNNPPCVLHVVEGTQRENVLDMLDAGTHGMASRTHCPQGHPYDEANTYIQPGRGRQCRACARDRARRNRAKAAGAKTDSGLTCPPRTEPSCPLA